MPDVNRAALLLPGNALLIMLCSVMAKMKLQELNGELLSGGAALWRTQAEQHLLQTTALARFLSYLAFAFAEGKQDRVGTVHRHDMCSMESRTFFGPEAS